MWDEWIADLNDLEASLAECMVRIPNLVDKGDATSSDKGKAAKSKRVRAK